MKPILTVAAPDILEKDITSKLIKALNKLPGTEARKRLSTGSSGTTGYPDITGTVTIRVANIPLGIRLEIEMKRPGKEPRSLQYSRLRKLRRQGCIAIWADSVEGAMIQVTDWIKVKQGQKPDLIGYSDIKSSATVIVEDLAA